MQKVTVKDIKVKEGMKGDRPWKLVIITGDDGSEFTTFDTGAMEVGVGGVIELEPVIKAGKTNFSEFKILQKGSINKTNNERPGMTPEMWAEKDRLERWSRECNACFMGIMELTSQCVEKGIVLEAKDHKLKDVIDAALDWALAHFQQKPAPVATKSTESISPSKLDGLVFANPGEFYAACLRHFKLQKSKVDPEIAGFDLTTEKGRSEAWMQIVAAYGEKPNEKDTPKKEGAADPDKLFE